MSAVTAQFQRELIRALRGCLTAWEKWIDKQQETKSQSQ